MWQAEDWGHFAFLSRLCHHRPLQGKNFTEQIGLFSCFCFFIVLFKYNKDCIFVTSRFVIIHNFNGNLKCENPPITNHPYHTSVVQDAIISSLTEYNQHIDSLKEEMEEATKSAEEIRREIQSFRNKYRLCLCF